MTDVQRVIKENNKVILDFYADWCGPCKVLDTTLKRIQEGTDISVVKINIEEDQELAKQFDIMSVPTCLFYEAGDNLDVTTGNISYEKILDIFA